MTRVRLYDPKSGLHMDHTIEHAAASLVISTVDATHMHTHTFKPERVEHDGRVLYKFARHSKRKI